MKALKWLFDFYINSSIHVGLAVAALTWITYLQFSDTREWPLLLFVFFGTITGYNFVKYAGIAKLHHRSLANNLRIIQIFSFLSFTALVYFTLQVNREVWLVAGVLGTLTLLYALPVFNRKNLRTVAGIKVYVIALIWAGVSVLFPMVNLEQPLNADVWLEFFQRFLLVIVLLLPFEIRDLKYDPAELGTIPQKYGLKKTKILGLILLGTFVLADLSKATTNPVTFAADAITILVAGVVLVNAREEQNQYYTTFVVEGIPLLWLLLLLLFRS